MSTIKEDIEKKEKEFLSPYASLSIDSKGRKMTEEDCYVRTEFQRDRDRIIHSKSFRRLKHKTQVFISPEGDHFRTRLTHTLEVSQIARTIARALYLNEDLTEAIALAHDLGHTPFGHAGEETLNEIYPDGFRHNEQSLRVVDVLEEKKGLNLTEEVRDGILCHTGKQIPFTLEGQIVRIADRIAYINHDIDDAIRGGILSESDLPQDCVSVLGKNNRDRINIMIIDIVTYSKNKQRISMSPSVWDATDSLRAYLFNNVYVGSRAKTEEGKTKHLIEQLFWYYLDKPEAISFELASIDEKTRRRRVCDYIAGMTDRFAISQYQQFFVPKGFQL